MTGISHIRACGLTQIILSEYGGMPAIRAVGVFADRRGQFRKLGVTGEADVQSLMPDGRYCGVEVKTGTGRLSKSQRLWRDAFLKRNGVYILAHWKGDLDGSETIRSALESVGYARRS